MHFSVSTFSLISGTLFATTFCSRIYKCRKFALFGVKKVQIYWIYCLLVRIPLSEYPFFQIIISIDKSNREQIYFTVDTNFFSNYFFSYFRTNFFDKLFDIVKENLFDIFLPDNMALDIYKVLYLILF